METVAQAINRAMATPLDRPFIYQENGITVTIDGLRDLSLIFREQAMGSGLADGDLILLEFPSPDWHLFAAAYVGSHLAGLVPVIIPATAGAEQRAAVTGELPVQAVCTPARTGLFDFAVARSGRRRAVPDVAEYLLTSGTTGKPKVVAVSHAARLAGPSRTDTGITAIAIPPGSNAAQTVLAEALLRGGGLACLERWSPGTFLRLVTATRAKSALLAPAMAASLVRHPGAGTGSALGLRSLRLGMAPASSELIDSLARALPGTIITNIYTTTEAWPAGTVMRYSRDDPRSVGRPLPGTLVRVVDAAGDPVPADVQGHVQLAWKRGPGRAAAWTGTGDIGSLAPDGTLSLVGREGEIVTRGGSVVSLAAVDSALLGSGLVLDAMSYRLERAMNGELVGAAVVWSDRPDEDSLRAHVRERLGSDAVPAVLTGLAVIPRDSQGKIRRAPPEGAEPAGSSADPVLAGLRVIWTEILGHSRFSDADDFFAVGGDSLAAAMCNTFVEERLGALLPLSVHYEAATLAQLANAVRAQLPAGSDGTPGAGRPEGVR